VIKVYILVSGLFLSAPNDVGQPTELRFLFPQIPVHAHTLSVWDGASQSDTKLTGPAIVSIDNLGSGAINRMAVGLQPQLGSLTGNPSGSKLRPECAEAGDLLTGKCAPGPKTTGVHGLLQLEGSWQETPALDCCAKTPPTLPGRACESEFVTTQGVKVPTAGRKKLANAWLYESFVVDVAQLQVTANGSFPKVDLAPPALCALYDQNHKECVLLWFHNDDGCAHTSATDEHFARLYDLVATPPLWKDRLVPTLVDAECNPCSATGYGGGGYGRCTGGGSGSEYP